MSNIQFILTIAVCAAATMLTRFLPFLVFGSRGGKVPEVVEYLGHVLPAAIFGMLIVYCLKGVSWLSAPHGAPELLAIAAVGAEYAFLLFVLRLEAVVTELSSTAPALLWATAALGLALFLLYDLCLDRLTALYRRRRK